jgi:hypothetical protein
VKLKPALAGSFFAAARSYSDEPDEALVERAAGRAGELPACLHRRLATQHAVLIGAIRVKNARAALSARRWRISSSSRGVCPEAILRRRRQASALESLTERMRLSAASANQIGARFPPEAFDYSMTSSASASSTHLIERFPLAVPAVKGDPA